MRETNNKVPSFLGPHILSRILPVTLCSTKIDTFSAAPSYSGELVRFPGALVSKIVKAVYTVTWPTLQLADFSLEPDNLLSGPVGPCGPCGPGVPLEPIAIHPLSPVKISTTANSFKFFIRLSFLVVSLIPMEENNLLSSLSLFVTAHSAVFLFHVMYGSLGIACLPCCG